MSEKLFPAILLAGGLATRLRPLTENIPKSLIDINGEPFIAHQLKLLKKNNITDVVICSGYLGEQIQNFVGNGANFGLNISYSFDGPNLLGTAGAIKKAINLLDDNFFVIYGDSYLPCNYLDIQHAYLNSNKISLMSVYKNHNKFDKSNVIYKNGNIVTYDKKNHTKEMQYIDYGLGIFNKKAFNIVPENNPYDLADLYQTLLKTNQLSAIEIAQRFYEIGSISGIKEFKKYAETT